ncbi:MAG TPA: PDZ domain-containing protein [Terriglobales bacterium]|nr:PDZ domain-containing protein [Terriglobales bacterium]
MSVLLGLLLCGAVAGRAPAETASASPAPASLRYTVVLADPARHLVQVELHIPPGAADHDLELPAWNALYQIRDFAQYVHWVHGRDEQGNSLAISPLNPSRWHIARAAQGAEIEYETFANDQGPFGAQLNGQHAFFNLAEILIYPVDLRSHPIELEFRNVPTPWKIATALAGSQEAGFRAENYDRLVDAPVEIGTFREEDFEVGGGRYRVIIDAEPADYNIEKIVAMDESIVAAETSWVDDQPQGSYVFIYHFPRGPGYGGMEHADSTAIDESAHRLAEDPESLAEVTAHEFFHRWNVKRIRPQSLEPVDYSRENYSTALWFSEGVTSTVGEYAMLRAGRKNGSSLLKDLAREIRQLEERPAHLTQSAEASSLGAWLEGYPYYQDPARSISYYNKGFLLGILLDLELRERTQCRSSLREVLRWMNQNYARQNRFFPDSRGVREAAEAVAGSDFGSFFEHYVAGTEELPWNDFFRVVGLQLIATQVPVVDPGFTVKRPSAGAMTVLAVAPASEAERSGLAVGDLILTVNGQPADVSLADTLERLKPGETLNLRVRGRGGERDLEWKPGWRERADFELRDRKDLSQQQKTCRAAWLLGEPLVGGAHP